MNQRSTNGRIKEQRRHITTRKDEQLDEPRRSSTERSRPNDKFRSRSRDGQNNLVFRSRQEFSRYYKTPENSPCRLSHSDSLKTEGMSRTNGSGIKDFQSRRNGRSIHGSSGYTRCFHGRSSQDISQGHSEDSRLLRLLQRLERDDDRERQLTTLKQLKEFFIQLENTKVISANLSHIISVLEDFLHHRLHTEVKQELAPCLGMMAVMLGTDSKNFFDWIFSTYNNSTNNHDLRILLMKTVTEALKQDENGKLSEMISMIMTNSQSSLENADSSDLLIAIVDVVLQISSTYPSVFSNNFRDTVDIIIGWHIDSSQTNSFIKYTSKALVSFHQFWIADLKFSLNLLGQFLEDMEAYAEDVTAINYNLNEELASTASSFLAKINCLIRVFTTVLKSLGKHATPTEGSGSSLVTWKFLTDSLKSLLKCIIMTTEYAFSENLLTSANKCVCLLMQHAQANTVDAMEQLTSYIALVQKHIDSVTSEAYILSFLQLMLIFVKELCSCLPIDMVENIFSSSLFQSLRLSPNSKIQAAYLSLQHAVLGLKNVPVLEKAYKCILSEIKVTASILFESDCDLPVDDNKPKNQVKYSPEQAEVILLSNLCALAEIGNAKHSIIGMWALKPGFFDLIVNHLQPESYHLAVNYPSLQYALLYILYSHSARHAHFISSSSLISQNLSQNSSFHTPGHTSPILASVSVISPPSSSHLSRSFKILSLLFKLKETPFDSKLLAVRWSQEIFQSIQQHLPRLCRLPEIKEMIESIIYLAYTTDSVLTRTCCSVLQTLVKSSASSLPDNLLKRCFEVCILKLSDHNPDIQEDFSVFLTCLPLHIISSQFPYTIARLGLGNNVKLEQSSMDDSVVTVPDIWLARRGHMNRSPLGTFHSHNFRTVMAYILQGTEPKDKDWLLRLFYTSQHVDKQSKLSDMLMTLMVSSSSLLWFWTTFEVAQMCVLNKLRTPLGKPQETFTTIEAAIKAYAKQVGKPDNLKPNHRRNSGYDLLRVRLLLDIMEHLEKLMYNAYEGCALTLSTPPKTVRTFFRTNKGTCLEWLSRVRTAILVVSLQSGQLAVAVRQGYQLLQEMSESGNTQGTEFEQVLMYVIQALVGLQCPEAILGLYNWCKELHGRKFTWIKAAVDQATGRYETSAFEYICILYSLNQNVPPLTSTPENFDTIQDAEENDIENESNNVNGTLSDDDVVSKAFQQLELKDMSETKSDNDVHLQSFLMEQVIDCYRNIGSWSEALKWTEMERKIRWSKNGMMVHQIFSDSDLMFLKTLSVFDDGVKSQFNGSAKSSLDFSAISKLGGTLDNACWERKQQLRLAESTLLTACMEYESIAKPIADDIKYVVEEMKKSRDQVLRMMKISVLEWPPFIEPIDASLYLGTVALLSSVQKGRKISPSIVYDNLKLNPPDYSSSFLSHVLAWNTVNLHVASKEQGIRPQLGTLSELQLIAARLARKQQNYKLAQKLLLRNTSLTVGQNLHINLRTGGYSTDCLSATHLSDIDYLLENLRSSMLITPTEKLAKLQIEGAKLLHSWGDTRAAAEVLINSVYAVTQALNDSNDKLQIPDEPLRYLNARSLLTLVKYLQQDMKQLNDLLRCNEYSKSCPVLQKLFNVPINGACFGNSVGSGLENKDCFSDLKVNSIMNEPEFSLGKLLQCAVTQCPNLGKAWASLASWYYRWGRKATDMTSDGCIELTTEEKQQVLNALTWDWNEEEKDSILQVISQIHASSESEWDDHGVDAFGDRADLIRRQLLASSTNLQSLKDGDQVVEKLVDVWRKVLKRVYRYYELSAKAYFQFIHLNSQCEENERCEDDNVTATLRLLRLVVKHAAELRDVLEKGLAKTPTAPWRGIIPQLFSRLNHPEPYVRQSISDLLCRVAQASPHLIVFPAVVGSLTIKKGSGIPEEPASGIFATCFSQTLDESSAIPDLDHQSPDLTNTSSPLLSDDDDESEEEQQNAAIMQNCFTALVETLARQDAHTIAEVKNLVHELRRITLLWDEMWVGTLNLHHAEVNRRIQTLEEEIKKVQSNSSLTRTEKFDIIREKHAVFMRPTMFVLEQLQSISSQSPETPHEQWFQDTFGKHIEDTLIKFKNPLDPSRPQQTWALYKHLHQMLQQRIHQQTRSHLLMEQISPSLSSLQSTRIPMPGINTKSVHVITIDSVHNNVSILPTKTKPKKLAFIGSDGDKDNVETKMTQPGHLMLTKKNFKWTPNGGYTYLFKGLEDLHLDERIMQFLSIVNNMFMKNKRHGKVVYQARHYSVTPLGPRSGLIQWVDGATPLFGLYKRWQQREATAQALKNQSSQSGNIGVPPSILRPSEIYYNTLTPLLKEKGITNLENRKEWPLSVLIQTLKELMAETPKDLLAKELWCCCSTALEWWELTQTYNHSTAVMSMIGYIIGLGDRHLDNVLVDLSTGEVVHIDYNVCFEKGKNLRVPEKVPFRMTPNIETALGVTGIEGIFRVSCEHVLKVLRKGREPLLTLLEAFVYDPLVDWTPGNEGGYTGAVYGGRQTRITENRQSKQEMELEVAYSMLSIRVAEMKHDWIKNRDELLSSIPKLKTHLKEWHTAQVELQSTEAQLPEICQQRALLEEAQTNPNHSLFSLPKRFDEHAVVKATIISSKEAVKEKLAECKKWQNLHSESLRSVCGSDLGKWCSEVATNININSLSIAPVVEFLQTAGQGQLVQQCEHAETDLGTMLQQQQIALTNCVELLRTYATIVLQYPPEFKEQNRSFQWQCWLDNLLNDFSLEKCQEVITEFHNKYGIESMNIASIQAAIGLHYQLQSLVTDVNTKLVNVLERQHIEGLDDLSPLSVYVREAKSAIQHFVEENGDQGKTSVECVIITALCALNRRLLLMDNAAAAAGDCLVDLTSWGGDWYLDEMYSMSNSMIQLISILQEFIGDETGEVKAALHAVNSAHCVFTGLEDLSLNFQNIILPEAVKTVQSEDPSVLDMISKLTKIISNAGSPLDSLIAELEADIRNIIMEIQTPEKSNAMEIIEEMKRSFDLLMKGEEPEISDLTPGQMLLMGFNGLFTKLESDMSDLLSDLNHLSPPLMWRKVDLVREAASFMPPIHLVSTRTILCDIFFLKRLQAMQQFFTLCREFSLSLRIPPVICNAEREGNVPLLTDEQLFKPVKLFIAEYVRKQVLGLPSQTVAYALCILILTMGIDVTAEIELRDIGAESKVSLEELSKKAVDLCMKQEQFQAAQLTQASTLISTFDSSWRKEDLARRLDQSVLFLKASLQRAQLQLARHQWLNEDLLVQGNIGPLQNLAVPTRASVMSEMRKTVQALVSVESAISVGQERYLGFTASVEQRLKWAAGANPSLVTIQEEFEASIAEKTSSVTTFTQLSRELGNVCNAILHFEALRTRTNEALSSDTTFLSLINRCQESCMLQENCSSQVTLIEEHLLNLKPLPDSGVTQEWISTLMEKVSQLLASCKEKLEEKKMESYVQWDIVKSHVGAIRTLLSTHHRHMSDIRNILRTLAKYEEQDFQIEEKQEGRLHRYITTYRIFSEQISGMVREILSEGQDLECSQVEKIISKLDPLESMTQEVYDELLNLAGPMGKCRMRIDSSKRVGHLTQNLDKDMKGIESKKHNLSTMQGQELLSAASPISEGVPQKYLTIGSSKKNSVMRDPRTGKIIQERNTYATNVWRRVKMKLDGRDPDPNKRSTIAEQVDFVIKEATNLENLAVLYEGWTPWV